MSRRKSRLCAIQYIYSKEFSSDDSPDEFMDYINAPKTDKDKEFTKTLINGCLKKKDEIDGIVSRYAQQGYDTVLVVDRCILRVGIFEMLYLRNTPPPVIINEYVEIAKHFSNETSKSFINALLDKVRINEYEK